MGMRCSTATTALLLVDGLNDFLDEKRWKVGKRYRPMIEKTSLKSPLQRLLSAVKVFYVPHGFHQHSFDGVKHCVR